MIDLHKMGMEPKKPKLPLNKVKSVLLAIFAISTVLLSVNTYTCSNTNDDLLEQVKLISNENVKLQSEKEQLSVLKDNLSTEIEEYKVIVSTYENTIDELRFNNAELESENAEIELYRDTYKSLESECNDLKTENSTLQSENKELRNQLEKQAKANDSSSGDSSSGSASDNASIVTNTEDNTSYTVYITETGNKYHSGSCSYLRKSKISISKSDAVSRGYTACSRCNP